MNKDATQAASPGRIGGGTFGSRPRGRLTMVLAAVVVAAIAVVAGMLVGGGGGRSVSARNSTYGGYPTWLTETQLPPVKSSVLQATAAHPKLQAIEGNTVDARLAGAEALITAVGPQPAAWVATAAQEGRLNSGAAVPVTFDVTVIARRGTVPLHASEFSILTAQGQLIHPAVTLAGKRAPTAVASGQHVNLTLTAKLPEGNGSVRWAPAGTKVLTGWLYELELD